MGSSQGPDGISGDEGGSVNADDMLTHADVYTGA
jgi:hypothetical protein